MEQKFYICKHCGNIIAKVKDTGVPVICCGEPMSEIIPGTTDAAVEKHVPVWTVENGIVHVKVGSVEHPMLPEHYIEWVSLHTKQGNQRKEAAPRREARGLLRSLRGRRGRSGLRLLQPPQSVESVIHPLKNPVLQKAPDFFINVTSSHKKDLSCGMIKPQSRKRWRT